MSWYLKYIYINSLLIYVKLNMYKMDKIKVEKFNIDIML